MDSHRRVSVERGGYPAGACGTVMDLSVIEATCSKIRCKGKGSCDCQERFHENYDTPRFDIRRNYEDITDHTDDDRNILLRTDDTSLKSLPLKKSWSQRFEMGRRDETVINALHCNGNNIMTNFSLAVPESQQDNKLVCREVLDTEMDVSRSDSCSDDLSTSGNISCLFPEILTLIFQYLDVKSKGRVACVSSSFKEAAYRHRVWRGVEAKLHLRRPRHSVLHSLVQRGITKVQILSLRKDIRGIVIGLPEMSSLNLSGCYNISDQAITRALTHDLPHLTTLNISLCKQITDAALGPIAKYLKNLQNLDISGCSNITNNGVLLIAYGLKSLRLLNVRSCKYLTDQSIEHLAGVNESERSTNGLRVVIGEYFDCVSEETLDLGTPALETLVLQDCQRLSEMALKHISVGLTQIRSLNLSFCTGITDTGLRYLAQRPSLQELNLRSCDSITDAGIGFLSTGSAGGSQLICLDVSFCERVGNDSLAYIAAGMPRLRELSVCSCAINDAGLERLTLVSPELRSLNIGQCALVTDSGLENVAERLKNLESIDLYGCTKITTVGLEKIMKLPRLSMLNLGLWHKS